MRPIRTILILAALASLASLAACGGEIGPAPGTPAPGYYVEAPTTSALSSGQFCRQNVDGSCLSQSYPVALVSYLCNPGTGTRVFTIYGAFQQLNPSGDGVTFIERHLPLTGSVTDAIYLDCATSAAQIWHTGLPYYDQATWNMGTLLRGQGSLGCTATRYIPNVSHAISTDVFFNMDVYASTGGTNHGRINAVITAVNGVTNPSGGICSSTIPVAFSF